jgi:SAM-dependent methyltransferase
MKNTRRVFPLNCLSETVVKTREIRDKELPPFNNTDTNERKIRGIRDDGRVPPTTTIQTMMMEEEIFFCDEDKDKDYKEEMNHQLEKEIETLRTLTENGVGKRFDLYEYSQKSHKIQCWWCYSSTNQTNDEIFLAKMENARVIFEQIRPQVLQLMVLEEIREKKEKEKAMMMRMMMDDEEQGKKRTSCTNRNNRNNFVYGEVVLEPFYDFLSRSSEAYLPQSSSSRKYYDLGSGTGKSVFIAALTGKFSFAGGCEILECLHGVATTVVEDYREMIEPMTNAMNNSNNKTTELRVDLDDIFSVERVRMWSQCEYVFCNCLTWEDEQMETLARAAEHLKEGSIFVTVLLPLPSEKFEVIAEEECLFSWGGEAPLVIHRKRRQLEGENDLLISLGKLNNERCS